MLDESSISSSSDEDLAETTPEFNSDSTELQLCRVYHNQDYVSDDSIKLHCGLKIYKDGTARQSQALMHVNFDFNQESISKIELLIPFQLVNIHRSFSGINSIINSMYQPSDRLIFGALNILNSIPYEYNADLVKHIEAFSAAAALQQQLLGPLPRFYLNGQQESKDNQFQSYLQYSFNYLKSLPTGSMYTYSIGRVNPQIDQLEMSNFGYSQAYLDLIGINPDTLTSLLLRKKKVDLLLNSIHINKLTLNALEWINYTKPTIYYDRFEFEEKQNPKYQQEFSSEPVRSEILTFDGFKLTLTQRNRVFFKPFSYLSIQGKICDFTYEYFLETLELDIELEELEELIRYREKLVNQKGLMSLEDYLSRELSLMFEDVEYSVRSQEFLEKYYKEGLKQLAAMKEAKEREEAKKREEQKRKEEEQKKQGEMRCKYRLIK